MRLAEFKVGLPCYPTLGKAKAQLDHLDKFGDSDHAFGWSYAAGKALARSA